MSVKPKPWSSTRGEEATCLAALMVAGTISYKQNLHEGHSSANMCLAGADTSPKLLPLWLLKFLEATWRVSSTSVGHARTQSVQPMQVSLGRCRLNHGAFRFRGRGAWKGLGV